MSASEAKLVELDPAGLWPLATAYDLKSHALSRLELGHAGSGQRADVNKDVLGLTRDSNETEPSIRVPSLDRTGRLDFVATAFAAAAGWQLGSVPRAVSWRRVPLQSVEFL